VADKPSFNDQALSLPVVSLISCTHLQYPSSQPRSSWLLFHPAFTFLVFVLQLTGCHWQTSSIKTITFFALSLIHGYRFPQRYLVTSIHVSPVASVKNSHCRPQHFSFFKSSSHTLDLILLLFMFIVIVVYIHFTNHCIQGSQELAPSVRYADPVLFGDIRHYSVLFWYYKK
jgi:hypothetical protein